MKLNASFCEKAKDVCCNVDVWGILINIILQVITLQRTNTENRKQIFPEKELRSPNFHKQKCVSDLYIPTYDLPILLQEICGPIRGVYKSLTDT